MTKTRLAMTILCVAPLLAALGAGAQAPAEGGAPAMPPELLAAISPGEHHKHLDHLAGSWDTSVKSWMVPGAPPTESKGRSEARWILGGRYLESTYTGDMGGMPFEGHGLDGYDNLAKQYVSTWVDSMGTGVMFMQGDCSEGGKVHTLHSEMLDPMGGPKVKTRNVTTMLGPDSYKMEMFMIDASGTEAKVMELVATRKKP
ncbi:MAG TPA: DUF1579 domain-containing protein [Thermoanaerobaculia bacterium]|nr:DUF1579 domain-containing protein [Thermoanaerobaculia bacterium]